jgi:excisionase family DNA binding protein
VMFTNDSDGLLLLTEVARRARVSLSTVRYWVATRKLPSVRPGRRRMVRHADLERFLLGGQHAVEAR